MIQIEKIPSFEFYGMGQLDTEKESVRALTPDCHWVRFEVHGSESVRSLLIATDPDLDASLALELANTIAARIAGSLSRAEGWEVMISPPRYSSGIAPLTLQTLESSIETGAVTLQSFRFLMKEHIYPIQTLFVASPSKS